MPRDDQTLVTAGALLGLSSPSPRASGEPSGAADTTTSPGGSATSQEPPYVLEYSIKYRSAFSCSGASCGAGVTSESSEDNFDVAGAATFPKATGPVERDGTGSAKWFTELEDGSEETFSGIPAIGCDQNVAGSTQSSAAAVLARSRPG
jgi:hypothetical protein